MEFRTVNACGLACLCWPVQSAAFHPPLPVIGCGKLFAERVDVEDVVAWIQAQVSSYDRYLTMRQQLAAHSWDFTWDASALKLQEILG